MLSRKRTTTLYCFSPPVMVATATIEFALAIYSLFRYKKNLFTLLTVVTLAMLAAFQVAEFHICDGIAYQNLFWTKLGLTAITLLPPLGINLVSLLTGRFKATWVGYLVAAVYIYLFAISSSIVQGGVCGGNYVIINMAPLAYGLYYFGFIAIGLLEILFATRNAKLDDNHRAALNWIGLGYMTFLVPMGVVYVVSPVSRRAVPSIMCGFAVVLAFILAFKVLPLARTIKPKRH